MLAKRMSHKPNFHYHIILLILGFGMDRVGHFGGSMLLFFGILYVIAPGTDSVKSLALSAIAGLIAASMSVKPDAEKKFLWGIFHRTWITHSLTAVFFATFLTYVLLEYALEAGSLSVYGALAVFSATLSHVLLDSFTYKGVPLFGPFDNAMRGPKMMKGNNFFANYGLLIGGCTMALVYYGVI